MTDWDGLLKKEEQTVFRLRALFEQYGYRKFKMSKFEEYDFYAENRSFLTTKNIITFQVIYALSDFLIMILSWLVKQSLRAFLFQEVQP